MENFEFKTPFPTTEEGLLNLVRLDRINILISVQNRNVDEFKCLSAQEKSVVKSVSFSENGEVSIEFHDVLEAFESLIKMGVVIDKDNKYSEPSDEG